METDKSRPDIAYITAGAGGMICGSCLHDNTLARALNRIGVQAVLVPTYTPIRTDEHSVSVDRVFFGGINVFLQQRVPLFRVLPQSLVKWLDSPWLIRRATSRPSAISGRFLGALTVSMLKGLAGNQRREVLRLSQWLKSSLRPRMIVLTNMLIAGAAPCLKQELGVPLLVTLQGDDIFLDSLVEPYRSEAMREIRRLVPFVDGFLVHSRFYAEHMREYLGIPDDKIRLVPLGIDTSEFPRPGDRPARSLADGATIGYLARLAPEKGLHLLVDAFLELRQRAGMDKVRLRIAGWLGGDQDEYASAQFDKLRKAGLEDEFRYEGAVERAGKLDLLRSIDVFSVPTTYREPKGLSILEALAAGVPVVQPAHGAFPEMIAELGGGLLVAPNDASSLADALQCILVDDARRLELGRQGAESVHRRCNAETMARETWSVFQEFLP